jgi:carboxyl-terminal processing protease
LVRGISGIGVELRQKGEDIIVQTVLPDSPASASKAVHSGDRIIAIAQGDGQLVQMTGLRLVDAAGLLRGPKGSAVRVTIVPAGKDDSDAQVIRLVRGELKGVDDRGGMEAGLPLSIWFLRLGIALAHL